MQLDPLVTQSYARALFHVVQKSDLPLEQAMDEVNALEELLLTQTKFRIFIEGPQFREEDKEALVTKVLQDRLEKVFFLFLVLLLRRDRIEYLPEILEAFRHEVEREHGIVPGVVRTAIELDEQSRAMLQEKLEAFAKVKFHLDFKVDPRLIGGVQVKYGDELLDNSVATDLNALKYKLMHTRLTAVEGGSS